MSRSSLCLLPVVLALAACGASSKPAGAGFGLTSAGTPASYDPNSVSSSSWDVAVTLSPAEAQVHEESNQWSLSSSDDRGALTVMVMRDPGVNDAFALA